MNKRRLYIVIFALIAVLLIILLIINRLYNKETNLPDEVPTDISGTELDTVDSTLKSVDIKNNYYYIKNCVIDYYSLLEEKNIAANDKNITSEKIINMLDQEYIDYSGITSQNVFEKIDTHNGATIVITDMLVSQRSFNISIYFVYGIIRENGKNNDFSIMVKADRTNDTFKIYLQDYMKEKYSNIKIGDDISFDDTFDSIESNGDNTFKYKNISDETYCEDLFNNIKFYIMYDNEDLYDMLDENYRNAFSSYDNFYDYISKNYLSFIKIKFENYSKQYNDNITQYTIVDSDYKYKFIINEESTFKYTLTIEEI